MGIWCRKLILLGLTSALLIVVSGENSAVTWDTNGYILYCPCMGRFGNQAEHLLGSLVFAKALNRTLAIPPWRSYVRQQNVPFSDFFEWEPLKEYHRVIPLHDFMSELAPSHWPPGDRTGYCHSPTSLSTSEGREDCGMKLGNPFGPFWDEFSVEFDRSEFTRLGYRIDYSTILKQWQEKFPPASHPVVALRGAPASYPVLPQHRPLQRYIVWNDRMEKQAADYINNTFGEATPFIGVHLRMGSDWKRACENAVGRDRFMESVQCLEDMPGVSITQHLCLPPVDVVAQHLIALTRETRVYTVFVASDVEGEKHELQQKLGRKIKTYYLSPNLPQLDLILLAKANYFVGNCISSFTAFVKRERDVKNKPSDFFGISDIKKDYTSSTKKKVEL